MRILVKYLDHILFLELSVEGSLALLGHGLATLSLGLFSGFLLPLILLVPLVDKLRDLPLALHSLRLHNVLVLTLACLDHFFLMLKLVLVVSHVLQLFLSIEVDVFSVLSEAIVLLALQLGVFLLLILKALIQFLSIVVSLVPVHNTFKFE